ncbi:hypothetical protein ABEU86_20010 [Pseudomonas paraversuta]|uniref:hypothetical protein n=1 Tax=Pseudomonas paraversuta TaxID=2750624 RepID=UPI003D2D28CD
MEFTASSLAAELKRQIDGKLPPKATGFGGMNHFSAKASIAIPVSSEIYFDAIGVLLQQLADERPEWEIELEGDLSDLTITFSK